MTPNQDLKGTLLVRGTVEFSSIVKAQPSKNPNFGDTYSLTLVNPQIVGPAPGTPVEVAQQLAQALQTRFVPANDGQGMLFYPSLNEVRADGTPNDKVVLLDKTSMSQKPLDKEIGKGQPVEVAINMYPNSLGNAPQYMNMVAKLQAVYLDNYDTTLWFTGGGMSQLLEGFTPLAPGEGQPSQPEQSFGGQPGQPTQPFGNQPEQPFGGQPAQPAQPFGGQPEQPAQPFGGQPEQPFGGQPGQPAQPFGGQPDQPAQPFGGQPGQPTQPLGGQPEQPNMNNPFGTPPTQPNMNNPFG